jgi:oligopeptide transport system ATP-binding protein
MSFDPRNQAADNTATIQQDAPLLSVSELRTWFPVHRGLFGKTIGHIKAVDGISFDIHTGRTLGLVGESGCGKTTAGRTILRLIPATDGSVLLDNRDVFALDAGDLREARRQMQIIFQDPYSSLNPRMTVGAIVSEPMDVHNVGSRAERQERVSDLLARVGLSPDYVNRYPHEFSGGQRQRIGIARALALNPRLIICDEPVSALDVSIQAQILNLLEDLQNEFSLTYLFIAHDLSVVSHISDDVAVMYLGRIVEKAPAEKLYSDARHPYTWCLMSAIPVPDPEMKRRIITMRDGEPPSPMRPPPGCPFNPRCPKAFDRCRADVPQLEPVDGDESHLVACHLYG